MKNLVLFSFIMIVMIGCQSRNNQQKVKKEKVLWTELTPKEFRERRDAAPVAYLPLGTLEWHGEHLPLGADAIQPYHFFQLLAEEVGGIVMPPLFLGPDRKEVHDEKEYYGMDICSNTGKQKYPSQKLDGNAYWVPDSVYALMLENVIKQLKRQGFEILVAHGHGPSTVGLINNAEVWENKYDIDIINLWGPLDKEGLGFMCDHAAANETSLIMYFRGELVQMDNLPADTSQWPVGIGGKDPRIHASYEKGKEIVKAQKERMVKILKKKLNQERNY